MEQYLQINPWIILVVTIFWILPWKGYSLWIASKENSRVWFIILLIVNTFGILDIFYIFYIAKKKPSDLMKALKSKL